MSEVPFLNLSALHQSIQPQLDAAYRRVFDSGNFIADNELKAFEGEFASYCGVNHCLGVGNGLDALQLLLRAYEIGPGDEVIVPANTFIATWLAVTNCGATPVPVDPLESTYNIDPALVARAITPKTKAIIPVHLYGQPADMDAINEVAAAHGLVVIEDAAQAQGARFRERRTCALAHAAATSFYPGKNLGALGDGGAVLTNSTEIAHRIQLLRNYGSEVKYRHNLLGVNSRLDELQAAFLRAKLKNLDKWNGRRKSIAAKYESELASTPITLPYTPEFADSSWHLFVIRCAQRDELLAHLQQHKIHAVIHYPIPPHRQQCYQSQANARLPISEKIAGEILSLPMCPTLSDEDVEFVSHTIRKFFS